MHRRDLLRAGTAGFLGALLARYTDPRAALADGTAPQTAAKAKNVILLWMNGGPSHIDTWDPKPGTATGGPFKALKTSTPGLSLSEHMPKIAAQASKLSVLRMTSKEGNHQRAQYLMHTGYAPNPTLVHPSLGGWCSKKLGAPPGGLPAFVSLGGPAYGAGGGFLGVQNGPFLVPNAGGVPENAAPAVDVARFERRRALLEAQDRAFSAEVGGGMVDDRRAVLDASTRLMHSTDLSAFEIATESAALRAAYGDTPFGRGCLVARRLVERGVRFVEVVLDGWDTHTDNFGRVKSQLGIMDPAMGTLVKDLSDRHLLASTLVVWMGDFGRTPKINGNDGRDHWPGASSAVMAGGGTKPGLFGSTDAEGAKCLAKGYTVPDLSATIAKLAGLDPNEEVMTPVGRPIAVTDSGRPIAEVMT
ncbi:DUF1501 domain-containing protein [soil metagenome]